MNAAKPNWHVCIVTPGQIGSNPRVVKEATALHDAGLRVTVIATRVLDGVEPRDQSILREVPFKIERIDLRSRTRWRLRRIGQMAARAVHAMNGGNLLAETAFSVFTPPLMSAATRIPADLYIAHYPPALPAASAAARRFRSHYAFDAEDFHLGEWPAEPEFEKERSRLRRLEGSALKGCSYITAASPGIAQAYAQAYGLAQPNVVLNTFPLAQAPDGPTPRGSASPGPSLYWFSQVVGPNRGLECAIGAIAYARTRPHLYLRGYVSPDYARHLRALADRKSVLGRLHFLPTALPSQMERLAAVYDLGLCAEPAHTANNARVLSNKLFSYLLAGLPVLMSDTPAQRAFALDNPCAAFLFANGNAENLAATLDAVLGDAARLAQARNHAFGIARETYNWDRDSRIVVDLVRHSLQNAASEQDQAGYAT